MSEKAKQGDFIKELKGERGQKAAHKKRFAWEDDLATPKDDLAAPKTSDLDSKKALESPKPTEDLPLNVNGQIDLGEIREDLISQMKAQRKKR